MEGLFTRPRYAEDEAFPVGAKVRVVDPGKCYNSYPEMARTLCLSKYTRTSTPLRRGEVGSVLGSGTLFEASDFQIVGIHVTSRDEDYLIGSGGIEVIEMPSPDMVPASIMRALWATRTESGDATLVVGEQIAVCHSCVLTAASPVFAAALRSGMLESATRRIEVPGVDFSVIEGVLELLYVGSLRDDMDVETVLAFAHQYQIVQVAKYVGPSVVKTMTLENAASIVRFLRDFDRNVESTNFVDLILNSWVHDRAMMKAILQGL